MTQTRGAAALDAIGTASQELHIVVDAFEEALKLIQNVASGKASVTDAAHFLMEMERRKLAVPGYYDARQRLTDILRNPAAPGRYTEIGWEHIWEFRRVLIDIIIENPENAKQALAKPGLRRWFLGQMLLRSVQANTALETVTNLIETVFKEASR